LAKSGSPPGDGAPGPVTRGFAQAVAELGRIAERLDEAQISTFMSAIIRAPRIFCIGAGREGLATRAFAMRLMHLGKPAHWIWDDTTPAVGAGDLLIATSGSGEIGHIDYVVDRAREAGALIAVVTADPGGKTARKAGVVLWLPAAAYKAKAEVVASAQPMGNLFEQALLILFDQIVGALAAKLTATPQAMAARHRNVE
jgi:6-phospho-3-hexuloisomerase